VRVIAGRLRGRRLESPTWDGLRPTSDRLRETLFNILAPRVPGARVLDGYAGTGAVGIEALSRGAAHVTFVEQHPRAVRLIRRNLARCGLEADYTIDTGDVAAVLRRLDTTVPYDLILLDPPYDSPGTAGALEAAVPLLADEGLLVLEHATRRDPGTPPALARRRDVRAGDSTLTFYGHR
jgi:16S rRNA (guanine966-N2)-methyltransferase